MTRRELMLEAQAATAAYAQASRSLADAKFLARNGMANNLHVATMIEHNAYHRWLRASDALNGSR